MAERRRRALAPLLAAGLAAWLVASPARAQPLDVVLDLRVATIEALPVHLARALGLEERVGLRVTLANAGEENPIGRIGPRADAAIGTAVDLLSSGREDVEDVLNLYDRAPVAMVVAVPEGAPGLTGLAVAARGGPSLAGAIRREIGQRPDMPRLAAGGGWWGTITNFRSGQVDGVLDMAPLPGYLAQGRGLVVWQAATDPLMAPVGAASLVVARSLDDDRRARLVALLTAARDELRARPEMEVTDLLLDAYPTWEPDAVLEAVRAARACLNEQPDGRLSLAALRTAARLIQREVDVETARRLGAVAGE